MKFFRSSVELAGVAEQDFALSPIRVHDASQLDVMITVLVEVANLLAIAIQAHDREAAVFVRGFRTANVEEARSIR